MRYQGVEDLKKSLNGVIESRYGIRSALFRTQLVGRHTQS